MVVLADRYELAELLGEGGMARVVAARDRLLERRVAVKLIREELVGDEASRRRLLREARAAASLHHPNTVAVFDVGEDEQPFIVMELIEGITLADRLARDGALEVEEAVAIAAGVLDGLAAAHDRGLVHRDVKPSNVLLPDDGGVKLTDFGIAKALSGVSDLTVSGAVLGTPRYLAPEQAAGAAPSPAGDLYAVGAVLYECLVGHPPFVGDDPLAVALAHQQQPVPRLTEQRPGVPAALALAVERALAKQPEQRHPDARGMRAAVQDAAAGGTVELSASHDQIPATAPMGPASDATERSAGGGGRALPAWLRRWPAAAALALLLLAAGATVFLGGDGDVVASPTDDPRGAENGADERVADDAPTAGEGAVDAPDPQRGIGDLVADLAQDPAAGGQKGEDLLDGLIEVQTATDADERSEKARELITEIAAWLADGDVDAAIGDDVLTALAEPARPQAAELHAPAGLMVEVARDTDAWGDRAHKLLEGLEDLLDEDDPEDWREDAEKLHREVEKWTEDGRLDPELGLAAQQILQQLAG